MAKRGVMSEQPVDWQAISGHKGFAERFHNEVTAWIVLAVSLFLTIAGWYIANTYVEKRAEERFAFEVKTARAAIIKRMQEYENVLRGGVGLFRASDEVTRKDWHEYVNTLRIETHWPGIQGVGFTRMLAPGEVEEHVREVQAEGFPGYRVSPEGARAQYSAIVYLEPFSGRNLRAFGFDMFSEPVRRGAMEQARDTGEAAVSGRVTLVQETGRDVQPGILMYLPVYKSATPIGSVDERRRAIAGFVYSPFRIYDLMHGILGRGTTELDFRIYDDKEAKPEALLYDSRATGNEFAAAERPSARFNAVQNIALPGRTWTATFASSPALEHDMESNQPAFVAIAGSVVDLLLFVIILSLSSQRRKTAAAAQRLAVLLGEVQEANRFSRQLIETANVMVVGLDGEGRVAIFNHMAESVSGYAADDILGQPWFGEIIPASECGDLQAAFSNIPQCGSFPDTHLCPLHTRSGEQRLISWKNSIIPGNRPDLRTLSFGIDITAETALNAELTQHRHHLEDLVARRTSELENARQEAESANRAKTAFLANMSHELRTPMNAILGLTHLIQRDTRDMTQLDRLDKVNTAANQLLGILNDILDISNIESNRLILETQNFRLDNVVFNTVALFAEKAAEKGLELNFDLDPALATNYRGDPLRLQQVLSNFCSNAVKFTERGHIDLRVKLQQSDKDADLVSFTVQDTGIGIAPDTVASLGQAFTQADSSATRKYGGTGLGLAICRQLAERMGGEMGISSEFGRGSTFWFTARLGKEAAHTISPTPTAVALAPLLSPIERELRERHCGARILLAEDNHINQEVAVELLNDVGLVVDLADDGLQAVDLASQGAYDLVLLDIQMPGQDGLAAAKAIRALPGYGATPILALTANAFDEDRERCLAAGMDAHLGKPIDPEDLYTTLLRWLDRRDATGAGQAG